MRARKAIRRTGLAIGLFVCIVLAVIAVLPAPLCACARQDPEPATFSDKVEFYLNLVTGGLYREIIGAS